MNMTPTFRSSRGLTLIEILVGMSIFSVVMLISVGSLVSINDANKKTQLQRTVIDNLNFAIDNMARNLRVGTNYHCNISLGSLATPLDCTGGASSLAFEGYKGSSGSSADQIIYRLNGGTGQIDRSLDSGATYIPITSPELTIDSLQFIVIGAAPADGLQPKIIITVSGTATFKNGQTTRFSLETAVSQRKLDS